MLGQFIDAEIAHRNAKASRFQTSLQNYNAELAKKHETEPPHREGKERV
jgi:hypothetical protein